MLNLNYIKLICLSLKYNQIKHVVHGLSMPAENNVSL